MAVPKGAVSGETPRDRKLRAAFERGWPAYLAASHRREVGKLFFAVPFDSGGCPGDYETDWAPLLGRKIIRVND